MAHTFEMSGLGKAPFKAIAPCPGSKDGVFWCEHCGTGLTHRYYIKSADGIISIVGIDCLKKTGDIGLLEGTKRLIKQAQSEQREAERTAKAVAAEAAERAANNGKTFAEMAEELEGKMSEMSDSYISRIYDHKVLQALKGTDFGQSMTAIAYDAGEFTPRMQEVIADIVAKQLSGARKGTKAYLGSLESAKSSVSELCALMNEQRALVSKLKQEIINLKHGIGPL
ncbi:hypothetical protein [Aeromonas caviae]|uniref:hypothetical protein n=1 Tax=Aeromonas caviae TaxID=648 RepID=UPI00385E0BF5